MTENTITSTKQTITQKQTESILVVPRSAIIDKDGWYGIKTADCNSYLNLIKKHQEFHPRYLMEHDERYKQIIPYLIFKYQDSYFLMQRDKKASETRIRNKFTLGIGGHIRQEDMVHNSILSWAAREFHEEVYYTGNFSIQSVGLLNDDTIDVGRVHLGFVFIINADSPYIAIKSELASGALKTIEECIEIRDQMESWSAIVLDYLITRQKRG